MTSRNQPTMGTLLRSVLVLTAVMALIAAGSAYLGVVDFDDPSLNDGASAEGWGAVHPYLNITGWDGGSVIVAEDGIVKSYQGGSGTSTVSDNRCLDEKGLGWDYGPTRPPVPNPSSWRFDFAGEVLVDDFSIDLLDYGDYFPYGTGTRTATLTAYDELDAVLVQDSFQALSTSWDYDSCGTAGIQNLSVSASDNPSIAAGWNIDYVVISFDGIDPGIAFDNINFNYACGIESVDLIADGGDDYLDVGNVAMWDDGEYIYIQVATDNSDGQAEDFGWAMGESHVVVADSLEGIPQTKKHNPIPGHFPYGNTYMPWDDFDRFMIPIADLGPDLFIAVHAEMHKDFDSFSGPYWASNVVSSEQGMMKNGNPISDSRRTDPLKALGEPSVGDVYEFFSLGFGGEIIVEFRSYVHNGEGYDISVHETTFNDPIAYGEETADVFGWYDEEWHLLGSVSNHDLGEEVGVGYVDLGDLPYVEMVKIVDTSDPASFGSGLADGYDVDAVDAVELRREESAWGEGPRFNDKNWAMYFQYTPGLCFPPE